MVALTTPQAAIHPLLANGQPAVSCFGLHIDELVQRQNFAYERAKAKAQAEGVDEEDARAIASMTLWHSAFPDGLFLYVSDNELYRVAADLPCELFVANGCRELDFFDYGYVADVLRERLASVCLTPGDAQNLRRALAWVEQAAETLLPATQPLLTAAQSEVAVEATPSLAA